ncbi:MAG TPA: Wzz/FepE/Etk N-terminal domain-containing protein, partial [Anaerolineales bacterium]
MELKTYFDILVRRRRIALLVALATAIVVAAGTLFVAPRYQAQAMLRIVTPLGGTSGETNYQTTFASRLMNTYAHIATSDEVTTQLKTKLGLKTLP